MKKSQSESGQMLGADGFLSPDFVGETGLTLRLFAGAPSLLELALVNTLLASHDRTATFELLDDSGVVESRKKATVELDVLVNFMSEKFAKHGVIKSASNGAIAYFDQSNDFFVILSDETSFTNAFRLNREESLQYFEDMSEQSSDLHYLKALLTKYEPFI